MLASTGGLARDRQLFDRENRSLAQVRDRPPRFCSMGLIRIECETLEGGESKGMDDLHVNRHCYLCVAPGMDALLLTDFCPSNPGFGFGNLDEISGNRHLDPKLSVCLSVCLS